MARSRPLVMQLAADVRDFLRGTKDAERGIDGLADELDDAARASEKFEDDFKDAMKDASRAADREARKITDDLDDVGDEFGEVGREAGQEFQQNLSEGLSSGNLEDVVQDTLGGLVGSLSGPLGLAATAIAGVGALAFQQMRDEAERVAGVVESVVDAIDSQFDVLEGRISTIDRNRQFADWIEENKTNLEAWGPAAAEAGISVDDFAANLFLGTEASAQMRRDLEEVVEAGTTIVGKANPTPVMTDAAQAAAELLREMDAVEGAVTGVKAEQEFANEAMDRFLEKTGQAGSRIAEMEVAFQNFKRVVDNTTFSKDIYLRLVGEGAAYVNPANRQWSPSQSASSNAYSNQAR